MNTARIATISRIAKDANGNIINLAVIHLDNGKTIVRKLKPFLTDLETSGRLIGMSPDMINSINHPAVVQACTDLAGGTITGDFRYVKAGDTYVIEAGHPALSDKTHRLFGTVAEGDKVPFEKDGTSVQGFLSVVPSYEQRELEINARVKASFAEQLRGSFNTASASASSSSSSVSMEDIDEALIDEVAGALATNAGVEEPAGTTGKK